MKKQLVLILAGILLLLTAAGLTFFLTGSRYTVRHGYRIYEEQYQLCRSRSRAEVSRYFTQTYGADPTDPNFLSGEYQGEVPERMLDQLALRDCLKTQLLLDLGYQYKLIDFNSFPDLKKALKQENRRRRETAAAGGVIYGPREYDLISYTDYLTGNLIIQLPELMAKEYFPADDDTLRAYYRDQQETLFTTAARLTLMLCEQHFAAPEDAAAFQEMLESALTANGWEQAAADFFPEEPLEVIIKDNSITYSRYSDLYEAALRSPSGIGTLRSGNTILLYRRISAETAAETGFEEARDFIRSEYLSDRFSSYLDRTLDEILLTGQVSS